jgi:hypothetical protein
VGVGGEAAPAACRRFRRGGPGKRGKGCGVGGRGGDCRPPVPGPGAGGVFLPQIFDHPARGGHNKLELHLATPGRPAPGDPQVSPQEGCPVYRLGLFVAVLLLGLILAPLAPASGEKKMPDGDEKDKEEEKAKDKDTVSPCHLVRFPDPGKKPPTRVLATVEMKDGTTFVGEFRLADTLTIQTETLGPVSLKMDVIRFLDVEGPVHRVATHALETFYGFVQTDRINARLLATEKAKATPLQRNNLKRIVFPDPPRDLLGP